MLAIVFKTIHLDAMPRISRWITVPDPDHEKRGGGQGGGRHPDPQIRGGPGLQKKFFSAFRSSDWSENKGGGARAPRDPPLDPPLDHYQARATTHDLRGTNKLTVPCVKTTTHGLRLFRYPSTIMWNGLPVGPGVYDITQGVQIQNATNSAQTNVTDTSNTQLNSFLIVLYSLLFYFGDISFKSFTLNPRLNKGDVM